MRNITTSKKLIKNTQNFLNIKYYTLFDKYLQKKGVFYGWGRKKSGQEAMKLAKKHDTSFVLLEDGFIRSIGLGVDGANSFSLVEDDVGIYYDATTPSRLENFLNSYDFSSDGSLIQKATEAISLIKKHKISKYNHASLNLPSYLQTTTKKVLVVAQTAGDASLKYGLAEQFSSQQMIQSAIEENKGCEIYLKVHPDVLAGKKRSNIDIVLAKKHCKIITEDINPIVLLEAFTKVYTQTSQMGFEALLLDKEVVCFGMPFYAGWGLTDDRISIDRRKRKLSVKEIFAAAYLLYTRYYNPYENRACDIVEAIETIAKRRRAYEA